MDLLYRSDDNLKSDQNPHNSGSDLLIEVDYSLPFVVDENTSVEYEVKSVINQSMEVLKWYLFRVLLIAIVLFSVLYFQGVLMFMSDKYYMKTARIPLPDRIHEILEPYNHPFTPALCNASMFVFVLAGVFRIIFFTPLYYTLQITLRYVSLFGSAYFIRGFFVYMTTVPSCYFNCNPDLRTRSFFSFFIRIIAGYMGLVTNCTDLIISGHTMFTVTTCIIFCQNVKYLATKIICCIYTAFVLFIIIACKYHYTVDVLFGLLIAGMLHYFYYSKLDDYGVFLYNKIYHSRSKTFQESKTTLAHSNFLTKFLARLELLEERLVLGQKMRALYLFVNSKSDVIDPKLLRKFNRCVYLFGADESGDIVTLYRGSRKFNFYYWKSLYKIIFKRKANVVSL